MATNLLEPILDFYRVDQDEDVRRKLFINEALLDVVEKYRADYSIAGRNEKALDKLMKYCRAKEQNFDFYERSFIWEQFIALGELLANQAMIALKQLPNLTVNTTRYQEKIVDFPDGGCSCYHIYSPESILKAINPSTPVLVIFPSLTHNQDGFRCLIEHVTSVRGWYVVVMNRRGLCEKLSTPQFWICGNDEDTRIMFRELRQDKNFANRPTFAVGYSMGACQLTRYVGKYNRQEDRELDGILAAGNISGPLHPRDVKFVDEELMNSNMSEWIKEPYILPYIRERFFEWYHHMHSSSSADVDMKADSEAVRQHLNQMKKFQIIYEKIQQSTNIYEVMFLHFHLFEDFTNAEVIEKMREDFPYLTKRQQQEIEQKSLGQLVRENYEGVYNLFRQYDAAHFAPNIQMPFIAVVAKDDNVVSWTAKSRDRFLQAPNTLLVTTKGGSHCLFKNDAFDVQGENWAESVIFLYFESVLNEHLKGAI